MVETTQALYLKGIEQFNGGEFFECHETWEALWRQERGASRLFYKGLIQAAVALFHLCHGNGQGAEKLMAGAVEYLSPYRPRYLGLDVDQFLAELSACVGQAVAAGDGTGAPVVDQGAIPRIRLDGEPQRGLDVR